MIAVIKTGGKQYKVQAKDVLKIEKINKKEGDTVEFKDVLLIADDTGKKFELGKPKVKNAKVTAKVLEQGKAKKIKVVKYKSKVRYKRTYGHRQPFTKVEIVKIIT